MRKTKRMVKAALILMTILTVIFVSVVVYVNANANFHDYANSHRYVVYAAFKYEQDTPLTEWYTPEELGIVEVYEVNSRAVQIIVDREKEPFPFGPYGTDDQRTIFLYKDEFYTVSSRWVTFADEYVKQWQIPILGTLALGWVFIGVLFLKRRKKRTKTISPVHDGTKQSSIEKYAEKREMKIVLKEAKPHKIVLKEKKADET